MKCEYCGINPLPYELCGCFKPIKKANKKSGVKVSV